MFILDDPFLPAGTSSDARNNVLVISQTIKRIFRVLPDPTVFRPTLLCADRRPLCETAYRIWGSVRADKQGGLAVRRSWRTG